MCYPWEISLSYKGPTRREGNSFSEKGFPPAFRRPVLCFGFEWEKQVREKAEPCAPSSTWRTSPVSPNAPNPDLLGAGFVKSGHKEEDKTPQGWGTKLQSSGFFPQLAFASNQRMDFLKVMSSLSP